MTRSLRLLLGAQFVLSMLGAFSISAVAHAQTGKVTVVTSFSKDVTTPIKTAFEKANPGATLDVQNRNTNAGVKYLQETKSNNQVDLFWASAPDAFEVLKSSQLLQAYKPKATGIPEKVGSYPINDPQGYYIGFAASGYGIMWNTRYMQAKKLPEPKEWDDLLKPVYFDHTAIAAPSRSGTTHLTIETILQGEGWEKGWRTLRLMAGNFRQITERTVAVARRHGKQSERWIMGYYKQPADFRQVDKVVDLYDSLGVDRLGAWTYRGGYGTSLAAPDALKLWDRIGENYKRVISKSKHDTKTTERFRVSQNHHGTAGTDRHLAGRSHS